jgi:hypothetical protein
VLLDKTGNHKLACLILIIAGANGSISLKIKAMCTIYRALPNFAVFGHENCGHPRKARNEIWNDFTTFLSISDWIEYMLSGVVHYEHSQASETLLYDVAKKNWSADLCAVFDIDPAVLPKSRIQELSSELLKRMRQQV